MLKLTLSARFVKAANHLSRQDFELAEAALEALRTSFGNPHVHAGLGIRKLRRDLFECRLNQSLRIVFFAEPGALSIYDVMNHDDVSRFLRNLS